MYENIAIIKMNLKKKINVALVRQQMALLKKLGELFCLLNIEKELLGKKMDASAPPENHLFYFLP